MAPNGELPKIGKIILFPSLNVIYSREHLSGDGRFIHFFVEPFFEVRFRNPETFSIKTYRYSKWYVSVSGVQ